MSDESRIDNSIRIDGEITGHGDLIIDGTVHGKIVAAGHRLTIGEQGEVTAEVHDAGTVIVQGRLVGSVSADQKIEVASTASVRGDIRAPRVVLADGAQFNGRIDADPNAAPVSSASP